MCRRKAPTSHYWISEPKRVFLAVLLLHVQSGRIAGSERGRRALLSVCSPLEIGLHGKWSERCSAPCPSRCRTIRTQEVNVGDMWLVPAAGASRGLTYGASPGLAPFAQGRKVENSVCFKWLSGAMLLELKERFTISCMKCRFFPTTPWPLTIHGWLAASWHQV